MQGKLKGLILIAVVCVWATNGSAENESAASSALQTPERDENSSPAVTQECLREERPVVVPPRPEPKAVRACNKAPDWQT
ncbi:MAG: hypothetical protein HWE13_01365 [Gammaproteobacteria bacterium]|nr:hypothetical protein [Gammaproteobacteria bacterium]